MDPLTYRLTLEGPDDPARAAILRQVAVTLAQAGVQILLPPSAKFAQIYDSNLLRLRPVAVVIPEPTEFPPLAGC